MIPASLPSDFDGVAMTMLAIEEVVSELHIFILFHDHLIDTDLGNVLTLKYVFWNLEIRTTNVRNLCIVFKIPFISHSKSELEENYFLGSNEMT